MYILYYGLKSLVLNIAYRGYHFGVHMTKIVFLLPALEKWKTDFKDELRSHLKLGNPCQHLNRVKSRRLAQLKLLIPSSCGEVRSMEAALPHRVPLVRICVLHHGRSHMTGRPWFLQPESYSYRKQLAWGFLAYP